MPSADDSPDLAYRWSGPAGPDHESIVLLHGLGDSGDCWPDAVRRWSPGRRVVGVDLLGHGDSPRWTPAQLASADPIEEMYAAAEALVERMVAVAAPVLLVGHSMGAGIATALAARRPDLVRAAVLEEPAWRDPALRVQSSAVVAERVADCRRCAEDPQGALDDGARDNPGWPVTELEPWVRAKAQVDLDFLALGVASFARPWEDLVRRISVPTLVLVGGRSDLLSAQLLERARGLDNPCIRYERVDEAGHCVRRDRADAYHRLVDPFLDDPFLDDPSEGG
jgi:pimeloyl-ACP methyl ester carboxylesterase